MAGSRTFAGILPAITDKALGRRGLAFGGLLMEWASIVGPRLADRTLPFRIVFPPGRRDEATLHLRVASAVALDIQHMEPQLLERINGYLGGRAVARLKLIHATIQRPPSRQPPQRALGAAEVQAIDTAARTITDPGLSEALAKFGRAVAAARA